MKYRDEDLKKVQSIELDILKEIIRICEKNNIQYFTYAGTTLGTIRHQGFIPWDDDIDIGMMRDDYEKFLKIAPKHLRKGYTLQHFSIDRNTPTYFAKVRKDGTRFVEHYTKNLNIHHGIFVDIMPCDYIPDNEIARDKYIRCVSILRHIFVSKCTAEATFEKKRWKKIAKQIVRMGLHAILIPIPKDLIYKTLDRAMRIYNAEPTNTIGSQGSANGIFKYYDYFPLHEYKFEGITVMGPNNPDRILSAEYGNYMTLPPEHERYTHMPIELKV